MYDWNDEADAERFVRTYADLILRACACRTKSQQGGRTGHLELFLCCLRSAHLHQRGAPKRLW